MAPPTPESTRETPDIRTPREEFLVIPRDFPFSPGVVYSRISPAGTLRTKSVSRRNRIMRSEADTPIDQQFLMVFGRLSQKLIEELDIKIVPEQIEALRGRGCYTPQIEERLERYNDRNRFGETAIVTLYAYADIPLGRRYQTLWPRDNTSEPLDADCVVEHALFSGWFPAEMINHGHKHILIVRIAENAANQLPVFDSWDQIGIEDWSFGISDRDVAEIRHTANRVPVTDS